ncbi:MAG: glutamate formiminotransferase / 5-formyltetrahydrofolate cyclo-ligase [Thermoleophilaceae bacterium]|jgi:glutamate formiminotransferase|nr:glutamate formiminotransferase / 5-formyltetrahydrofolate cyclo-ligase [Thermoleophilaceae bacterium]
MLAAVLLAVPNVSEGRDRPRIEALAAAFTPARLLDVHSDADHNRSVFTLAGAQGELARALAAGAREAAESIDVSAHDGVHPRVGSLDVAPVVYLSGEDRGAAVAEALTAAAFIGGLGIPVFLYGQLATDPPNAERAHIRRGGPRALADRIAGGELKPDYGPAEIHPTAGATLVTARPPLIAFNVELASGDVDLARSIAAELRESGGGLPGVRAIGLLLAQTGRAQVSMNVHDHTDAPLAEILERIRARAPVAEAELVGLAPAAALADFPDDIPFRNARSIEDALDPAQSS